MPALDMRGSSAPRPRSGFVLAATVLASSLSFIDGSVVNVGLPAIEKGLGDAGPAGLQWVIDGYLLPLSALVLCGGALGDRLGRRRLLSVGIALFALASAGCAFAPDVKTLILGRIAQGTGAALLMPNSLAVLSDAFDGAVRGRAIGTWAAMGAATAGLGPVLGGWLIDLAGWRMIFVINLPLALAALVLVRGFVSENASEAGQSLDVVGGGLAVLGLGLLTLGLVAGAGPAGWTGEAWGDVVGGGVVLACFMAWEGRCGARAMMPLNLFASRAFVGLTLFTLLLYGALGALTVLLPYAAMQAGRATAMAAGAALLPLPIMLAVLSRLTGGLVGRFDMRGLLAGGAAIVAAGLLLFLRVDVASSYWSGVFPAMIVVALGMSLAVAPLTAAVLSSVDAAYTGIASGLNNAVARTGGLLATACLGRVLASGGEDLIAACHVAAIVAALATLGAALCAWASLDEETPGLL